MAAQSRLYEVVREKLWSTRTVVKTVLDPALDVRRKRVGVRGLSPGDETLPVFRLALNDQDEEVRV